jgi:hypothetical protein
MDERERPPPGEGRRATNRRHFADNDNTNNAKTRPPQAMAVTVVDFIIGRMCVVRRTVRFIFDPGIWRYESRAYKTGPRKGQVRRVRVWGVRGNSRISLRRYRNADLAARAYHATKRALGIGLLPFRSGEASLAIMGWAQLTAAGANCAAGQEIAARMRSLGAEPLKERSPGEFWWADC